jgi:hypothetical protein
LEPKVRGFMEDRFGADFSGVRVHTSERDLGVAAYTYGNRIAFARQAYQPRTPDGIGLVAHELAHVMQQGRGGASPGASSERAAGHAADLALQGRGSASTVVGGTALGVAGQSEEELARRRQEQAASMLPRGVQYMLDPGRLDREYLAALAAARQGGGWDQAAEILNGFNHEDIQNRLAELSDAEVHYMHQGALANRKVGPDANVARLTRPGAPRASTPAPAPVAAARRGTQGGTAGLTDDAVRAMSTMDRLAKAYELAPIGAAAATEIASLVTPRALVGALVGFVVVYGALQLTPVGWAANIGIALTAAFIGPTLFRAINGLVRFARAANATTVAELEEAGRYLADAIGGVGVQVILALVIRRTASNVRGSTPYNGPPPTGFADAVATNGMIVRAAVPVGASTVPARLAPAMAASLGLNAVPGTLAMMHSGGGTGGGGSSSGGSSPAPAPAPPAAAASGPVVSAGANPRTAGSGGIARISRSVNPDTGVAQTTIEGRVLPTLPTRAGLESFVGPARSGTDRAHLWGRIFGDEAAAGTLYAPSGFNRGVQLTLEKALQDLQGQLGAGESLWLKAVNSSHPRTVWSGKALATVRYEFQVRSSGGQVSRTVRIEFTVDPPGTPVTRNRPGFTVSSPFEGETPQ